MTTHQHVEILPWNANFDTGIGIVDEQHRGLVDLLNTLVSHLAYQSDAPTIAQVCARLREYAQEHFTTEDAIWVEGLGDDAWVADHRREHDEFIARIDELRLEEGRYGFDDVIQDVVGFLSRWLALHILDSDKRLAKALAAVAAGLRVEQAKARATEEMTGATRAMIDAVMDMYDKLATRTVQLTREISRRIRAEADLTQANAQMVRLRNDALSASQAKSDFLASMSHEIRAPLNAIAGLAHLVRRDGLSDSQRRRMEELSGAAAHLNAIVDAVLDLSKIEAGKMQLESAPVAAAALLSATVSMLRSQADAKGIELVAEIGDLPPALAGDGTRLQQALLNLAANAVKFTSSGRVTLRVCAAGRESDRVLLRFEVEDTGIGIEPEALERLFAPFEQADAAISRRFGGTGLGLVITRKLAELMGGCAGGRSAPGRGSVFWFTAWLSTGIVPAATAATAAQRAEDVLRQAHAGTRILVVDDEPINREIGRDLLEDAGLRVDLAADGPEAIERIRTTPYAFVLMDMQMPGMDGLECTARMREMPAGATVPIVAMTANAFPEDKARCLAAGMNDFVSKPVDPDVLFEVVLHWLDGGRSARGS